MGAPPGTGPASYAGAGVDVDAGERAVEALRPYAEKASRPEVLGGIGGFAGLFAPRLGRYREPHALCYRHRSGMRRAGQHDQKLLAAVSSQCLLRANARMQPAGDTDQHGISGRMAISVVNIFKMIKVGHN